MKKLYILCAMALGLCFAACDEVETSNALPQTNPQESPINPADITVSSNSGVINLQQLNAENEKVELAKIDFANAPEGYTAQATAQISKDQEFTNPVDVETTCTPEGNVYCAADALQDAYYTNVTKDPREGVAYVRYAVQAVNGKTKVNVFGPEPYSAVYELKLKPFDAAKVIDDSYTLELSATDDFSAATKVVFEHAPGVSPYDDPTFSVVANYTEAEFAAGLKWRIVSATGKVYGPAGATDAEGDLMEGAPAGDVATAAPLLVNIDMSIDTYSYKQAYECLYTPGTANGWSGAASQQLTTTDYVTYTGLVSVMGDGFKFNPDTDWTGKDIGVAGVLAESTDADGNTVYTGTANGSGNINTPVAGLYYAEINYSTKEFKLTYMSTIGIIGGFNGWGESIALTPGADFRTWTSDVVEFPANCEWKLRANDAWSFNWGTDAAALVFNGGNIVTAEAGKYIVTFDCTQQPYVAKVEKQ